MNIDLANFTETNSIKRSQSTTSLEEQIQNWSVFFTHIPGAPVFQQVTISTFFSPLPESPKPITRARKNKPAPIPPSLPIGTESSSVSTYTIVSTTATSPSGKEKTIEKSIQSNTKKITNQICTTTESSNISRRESFNNFDHVNRADVSTEESN